MDDRDQQAYALLREFYHEVRLHCSEIDRGIATMQEFLDGIKFDVEELGKALEYAYESEG